MRSSQRSAAISEAIALRQPRATTRQNTRQYTRPQHTPRLVYFNVGVYDISDPDESEPVEQLQAGETYLLTITCEDAPSSINQQIRQDGQPIAEHFDLGLSYAYDVNVTSPITPAKQWFTFDGIFHDQFPHALILPADLPSCMLTINIKLKTHQRPFPITVAQYELPVRGQEIAAPPIEIFEIAQINQQLPAKTAILLVESATQAHQVRLRGWSEVGQQLDNTIAINSIVSIEEIPRYWKRMKQIHLKEMEQQKKEKEERQHIEDEKNTPDKILKKLAYLSRTSFPQLQSWLNKLLIDAQEQLDLIVVDLTEKEFPWELLEMSGNRYLGVCARVIRWLPTFYFEMRRKLTIESDFHEGSVISYLDPSFKTDLQLQYEYEQNTLQYLNGITCPSLPDIRKQLDNLPEKTGLIYIGCHGRDGRHLLQQGMSVFSSIMLEGMDSDRLLHLTVFINACESARTIKNDWNDPSNFVKTFLAYGVSGFIGTLAQIGVHTAPTIARQILLAALQPGGVQIAEMLRILRKTEIEKLKQIASPTEDDYYRVIDTFMYVYYGNPLARLQLYRKEEDGQ
jgi:hypothetical protein